MGNFALAAVLALLGAVASGQMTGTVFPTYTHKEAYTTTPSPVSTTISLSPQTSVSVQHTIVRNKPAYPYHYNDKKPEASEETSYYYTYEDSSEEKKGKTTPITPTTTKKPSPRSFWSSQKAQLDARRKETAQKFLTSYSRPTVRPAENKPKVEFKVREKPKFGLASKNSESSKKESSTTPPTTTQKSVKFSYNEANLAEEKLSEKEEIKVSKGVDTNQILGRLGDIPIQNKVTAQILAPTVTPTQNVNVFGNSRNINQNVLSGLRNSFNSPSSFGNQQPLLNLNNNPDQILLDLNKPIRPQQTLTKPEEFLINLTKQQPLLNLNQQYSNPKPSLQNFQPQLTTSNQQRLKNPSTLLNLNHLSSNQQPRINSLPLQNQQTLLNTNSLLSQQPTSNNNNNNPPFRAFISTSPSANTASRTADYTNTNAANPSSTLLQRLGALGVNLANAASDSSRSGLLAARDGGYGGGQGLTFNLGPVADPLQILLRLLTLIPRPLLDLNGRLFFGIELGKNAGLVSGAVPVHKPVVG